MDTRCGLFNSNFVFEQRSFLFNLWEKSECVLITAVIAHVVRYNEKPLSVLTETIQSLRDNFMGYIRFIFSQLIGERIQQFPQSDWFLELAKFSHPDRHSGWNG